jgi:hypothetical protein
MDWFVPRPGVKRKAFSEAGRRAAGGGLDEPGTVAGSFGEAALEMAEQLAFEQLGQDRTAMDRHKLPVGARGGLVERTRDQFLAGAAGAKHQNGQASRCDPPDQVAQRCHRRRSADQTHVLGGRVASLQRGEFTREAGALHRPPDDDAQDVGLDGFGEEVRCAASMAFSASAWSAWPVMTMTDSSVQPVRRSRRAPRAARRIVNRNVVIADWLFTTPAVIVQPVTGVWLARIAGYPLTTG